MLCWMSGVDLEFSLLSSLRVVYAALEDGGCWTCFLDLELRRFILYLSLLPCLLFFSFSGCLSVSLSLSFNMQKLGSVHVSDKTKQHNGNEYPHLSQYNK